MRAAQVMINVAGATAGVNVEEELSDKCIVKVINGKIKNSQKKEEVMQFIREKAVNDLRIKRFIRQEHLDVPEDSEIKSIDTHYYILHLAVLYKNNDVLEIFYEAMKSDKDFCQMALDLRVETSINQEDVDDSTFFKLRDEVCSLSPLSLGVKYNHLALQSMVKIADGHGIMDDILKSQTDFRGFNLLHFATKNAKIKSLE